MTKEIHYQLIKSYIFLNQKLLIQLRGYQLLHVYILLISLMKREEKITIFHEGMKKILIILLLNLLI